ncbi:TPA: hypothetical protein ACYEOW_001221 [Raoultella terrigena]|uniref:hypothetical protein n=1 Tax=Raoultella terrigena TaxID=577 RepID=UPI00097759FC|nr:hypothetical protein [Raoultella terrigena]OMP92708.1 hypothetical protein BZP36_17615 [Raoultella terrigena]
MKVEFNDQGAIATATITSTVFEFRRHNRAVETTLFLSPGVRASSTGFFILKTVISGKASHVLRAFKTLQWEATR